VLEATCDDDMYRQLLEERPPLIGKHVRLLSSSATNPMIVHNDAEYIFID
jgi:hypothetical protein